MNLVSNEVPEALIKTEPIWFTNANLRSSLTVAYGPFVFDRGAVQIIGMYLQDLTDSISFSDGDRTRIFDYDSVEVVGDSLEFTYSGLKFKIRPLELKDASLLEINPRRPGLTKEALINEALFQFQPKSF